MLNELAAEIYQRSVNATWWENADIPTKLCLVHSEISEALEEYRDGRDELWYSTDKRGNQKPEGFDVELIDGLIRILDLLGHRGANVDGLLRLKLDYNASREYKHGGKRC